MLPVIWLLGLSGSGKTTLGSILRLHLEGQGFDVEHTDGDVFRKRFGFHGFSYEDRMRNINAMRQVHTGLLPAGQILHCNGNHPIRADAPGES